MTTPLWQQHHVDGVRIRVVDEMHSRVFLCVSVISKKDVQRKRKMYDEFVGFRR